MKHKDEVHRKPKFLSPQAPLAVVVPIPDDQEDHGDHDDHDDTMVFDEEEEEETVLSEMTEENYGAIRYSITIFSVNLWF